MTSTFVAAAILAGGKRPAASAGRSRASWCSTAAASSTADRRAAAGRRPDLHRRAGERPVRVPGIAVGPTCCLIAERSAAFTRHRQIARRRRSWCRRPAVLDRCAPRAAGAAHRGRPGGATRAARLRPLCAVYSEACAAPIHDGSTRARSGRSAPEGVHVEEIGPEMLDAYDPHGLLFVNVNTPRDYQRARNLLETMPQWRRERITEKHSAS